MSFSICTLLFVINVKYNLSKYIRKYIWNQCITKHIQQKISKKVEDYIFQSDGELYDVREMGLPNMYVPYNKNR